MRKHIHYENNAYFLATMIRNLHDAIRINVDAHYFADKILEDSLFINDSIQQIYNTLKKNNDLVRKEFYLQFIMKIKRSYVKFLEEMLTKQEFFGERMESMYAQFQRIAAAHIADMRIIRDELCIHKKVQVESDMISYEELFILMNPAQ